MFRYVATEFIAFNMHVYFVWDNRIKFLKCDFIIRRTLILPSKWLHVHSSF